MLLSHDHQWYQALMADLHAAVEALDCAGYRWDETDGWFAGRAPQPSATPFRHLEFWIDLGAPLRSGSYQEHAASIVYSARYQPDDDALSQSILHASIADIFRLLTTWGRQDGVRTSPLRSTIAATEGGWLVASIEFTLRYPWRD